MPRFDPHRPHSEVHGIVGVRFLQDGHTFNSSGERAVVVEPNIPLDPPATDKEKAEEWPVMMRGPDGNWQEPPPVILGPDGLPAQRVEADEEHVGPSITSVPIEAPGQPPEPTVAKDDMRLKENKVVKIQWEQYHEGEEFPGVAEAKRILGIA